MMLARCALLLALVAPALSFGGVKKGPDSSSAAVEVFKKRYAAPKPGTRYDVEEAKLKSTYKSIAKVYGDDNALEMVKAVPGCLAFDPSNFQGTYDVFCETFGEDKAKGMVRRNPNLLAVKPDGWGGATGAKDDTFYMSYVIAFTRPLGPVLLAGLIAALSVPLVEGLTGIPRAELLGF
uniref:PSI-F n=1 Tax=Pinguiococcus pyrenoidosus TaxID=172671 RepID=A0A7R9UE42_9STRA|mmetsp:Transcript_5399/g.21372  ORF Transcript_5399/g.21372 Transcript_5399/m.21372 type:complete len:179 (+) Transcript_5399:105-641(+)